MRTTLYLLALLALPAFAAQTVWKWVDDKGVTHYSDTPVPGATRVEISSGNRADPQPNYSTPTSSSTSQRAPALQYRAFEIVKPADGETFSNVAGVVSVNVRLDPGLQPDHELFLFLNGRQIEGVSSQATNFELKEVPRGEHRLVAVIQDARGRRVQETAVSFTVRQESIANPPVGPTLRPPPKPRPRPSGGDKPASAQPSHGDLNGARAPIDPATNAPVKPKPTPPKPKGG